MGKAKPVSQEAIIRGFQIELRYTIHSTRASREVSETAGAAIFGAGVFYAALLETVTEHIKNTRTAATPTTAAAA